MRSLLLPLLFCLTLSSYIALPTEYSTYNIVPFTTSGYAATSNTIYMQKCGYSLKFLAGTRLSRDVIILNASNTNTAIVVGSSQCQCGIDIIWGSAAYSVGKTCPNFETTIIGANVRSLKYIIISHIINITDSLSISMSTISNSHSEISSIISNNTVSPTLSPSAATDIAPLEQLIAFAKKNLLPLLALLALLAIPIMLCIMCEGAKPEKPKDATPMQVVSHEPAE